MSLISGNVTFGADAINCSSSSILGAAAFIDTASNQGVVSLASFSDTAVNEGTAVSAVFNDGAVNVGSLTSGIFLGTAVNSGVVTVAEFFGTASNVGVIVEAAKFADTSSNVGTVSGSAIFADNSVSNGIVEGGVQIAQSAFQGENQTLTETPTEYTQPDGFFPNGHYSGGVKAGPADYATVVHQVGNFWYKYDISGNGELASGNYNDGTSTFTFTNGVKGAAAAAPKNGLYSDGYYANGVIDITYNQIGFIQQAQDNGKWYTYSNGYATPASGSWGGTYYSDGEVNASYTNSTPQQDAFDNKWYTFTNGSGTIANGAYSNGYRTNSDGNGNIDGSYNQAAPQQPQDSELWYTYANGAASLANGVLDDDSGICYSYENGVRGSQYSNRVKLPYENINDGPSVSYYYSVGFTFGEGVTLYTDAELTNLALELFLANLQTNTLYTTTNNGMMDIQQISSTTINNTTYRYVGTEQFGNGTVVRNNTDFDIVANLHLVDNGVLYSTNEFGEYLEGQIQQFATSSAPNTYYYVGELVQNSTILYSGSDMTNIASDVVYISYGNAYGIAFKIKNGKFFEGAYNSIVTSNGTKYYIGTLTNNVTLIYNDYALQAAPEANLQLSDVDDLNDDGIGDFISTNADGAVIITYAQ